MKSRCVDGKWHAQAMWPARHGSQYKLGCDEEMGEKEVGQFEYYEAR